MKDILEVLYEKVLKGRAPMNRKLAGENRRGACINDRGLFI